METTEVVLNLSTYESDSLKVKHIRASLSDSFARKSDVECLNTTLDQHRVNLACKNKIQLLIFKEDEYKAELADEA